MLESKYWIPHCIDSFLTCYLESQLHQGPVKESADLVAPAAAALGHNLLIDRLPGNKGGRGEEVKKWTGAVFFKTK